VSLKRTLSLHEKIKEKQKSCMKENYVLKKDTIIASPNKNKLDRDFRIITKASSQLVSIFARISIQELLF